MVLNVKTTTTTTMTMHWLAHERDDLTLDFNIFLINAIKAYFMCVNAFDHVNIHMDQVKGKRVIKAKGQ